MSDIKFCPECGEKVSAGDTFCGMCGTALAEEAPESTPGVAATPIVEETETEAETEAEGGRSLSSTVRGILAFIVILVIIANVGSWLDWGGEEEPTEPETITFDEWIQQDRVQPEIPKKRGFSDMDETSDAESPETLEEALAEAVMEEIGSTGGEPEDQQTISSPESVLPPMAPAAELTLSGVWDGDCPGAAPPFDAGKRGFDLFADSEGNITGIFFDYNPPAWLYNVSGRITPSGQLSVQANPREGGTLEMVGDTELSPDRFFLTGAGTFRMQTNSTLCTGTWHDD